MSLPTGTMSPESREAIVSAAFEWEERIPIGVIYREENSLFEWHILEKDEVPLAKQQLSTEPAEKLLGEFY